MAKEKPIVDEHKKKAAHTETAKAPKAVKAPKVPKAEKEVPTAATPLAPAEPPLAVAVVSGQYTPELRDDIPNLRSGDEVKVYCRVIEGGKERIQLYEGTVIAVKNAGISRTVTVRKNSFGVPVERIFPVHSRLVQKIEIKKHAKVRRAKLYYLRKLKGKASRLKELRQ